MQIKEAIADLKYYIEEDPYFNGTYEPETDFEKYCHNHCKAIDTLLNYIEIMQSEFDRLEGIEDNTSMLKQELIEAKEHNRQLALELEKKDKIINEMADCIYRNIDMLQMLDIAESIDYDLEKVFNGLEDEEVLNIIKEYFTNKVEKEGIPEQK